MPAESNAEGPVMFDTDEIRRRAAGLSGNELQNFFLEVGVMLREYDAGTVKLRDRYEVIQQSLNAMVQSAPDLSGLVIDIPGSQWARLFYPDHLLGGDAPNLETLHLRNCSLPGPLPIFRGLSHLIINIYPRPSFPAPVYLGELLDFLDNAPQLDTLELDNAFILTRMDAELVPRRRKVWLPHLDYLEASGSGPECNYLLGTLVLPESCEVRLTATADGPQSYPSLLSAVARFARHSRARLQPFTHVDVVYRGDDDRNVLRVGFSPAFFHPPNVWWHTQFRLTLHCTSDHRPQVYRAVLHWLFRNLLGMQSIAFEQGGAYTCGHCPADALTGTDLFHIFGHRNMDGVHTVRMPFGPVAAFCAALSASGAGVETHSTGEVVRGPILRGLKTLVLGEGERCEWGELSDDEEDSDGEQGSSGRRICNPRVDGALAHMVRRRMPLPVPIERLVIKGYWRVEREFMDSLREKVGNNVQIEETFLEHIGEKGCTHFMGSEGTPCLGN